MRDESLVHIEPQTAEEQRAGIGGCRPLGVEVDLLADEVAQRLDLRSHEHVQFGGEQVEDVSDPILDVRYLRLVLIKRITGDDRHVNAPEIEQIVEVLGRSSVETRQ